MMCFISDAWVCNLLHLAWIVICILSFIVGTYVGVRWCRRDGNNASS